MLISNISVDNDAQLFVTLRKKDSSVTEPGAHMLLSFEDAWLFETPRLNSLGGTVPSDLIVLVDESVLWTPPPPKTKYTVSLQQVTRFFHDLIHLNVNTRTELIVQVGNYLHPENSIFFSPMNRKTAHASQCYKSLSLTKLIDLLIEIESFKQQFVIVKGLLQADRLKQHMVTIGID